MNKAFRILLTAVSSIALAFGFAVSPANAALNDVSPTSDVSITGNAVVGSVLTAVKPSYSWQETRVTYFWNQCTQEPQRTYAADLAQSLYSKGCQRIMMQDQITYTVTSSDVGKYITVEVIMSDSVGQTPPNNSAKSNPAGLLVSATAAPSTPSTPSASSSPSASEKQAPELAKAIPAKAKAGKPITIAAATKSKVAVKVKVAGKGCKVVPVKDKKKKIVSYKVTMGKKGVTCTVTVTAPATSTEAALNSVTAIKAS